MTDLNGITVSRMAQVFRPLDGDILAVRVAVVLVRWGKVGEETLRCEEWEVVLPMIEYLAPGNAALPDSNLLVPIN